MISVQFSFGSHVTKWLYCSYQKPLYYPFNLYNHSINSFYFPSLRKSMLIDFFRSTSSSPTNWIAIKKHKNSASGNAVRSTSVRSRDMCCRFWREYSQIVFIQFFVLFAEMHFPKPSSYKRTMFVLAFYRVIYFDTRLTQGDNDLARK